MRTFRFVATLVLLVTLTSQVTAAVILYGKKKVTHPNWGDELTRLVNDSARVDGRGQLGTVEFDYAADGKTLNRLVAQYAKLEHTRIYLTVDVGLLSGGATLQIRDRDEVWHGLKLRLNSEDQLERLQLPKGVAVEAMPAVSESIDPKLKAQEKKLWDAVQKRVKEHEAAAEKELKPTTPGN